jgi:pyruvate dehydrogenase E1 component alpha subunit
VEFVLDDVVTVLGPTGDADPAHDPGLSEERLTALYGQLLAARRLDEAVASLRDQGRIAEHLSARGEEAVTVGAATALEATDWLFPAGRDAAAVLARGVPLELWMSHILATAADPSKARQGPDRFSSRAWRVVSSNPRASSQLTQAAGLAWAIRARGEQHAVLATLDEVAAETGEFHNGMNFAGVFRAPVVFVARTRNHVEIARKAFAYGITACRVDGRDVLAVHRVVRDALDRARRGEGATLIEATLAGESDPVARMRAHLAKRDLIDEGDDARCTSAADDAIAAAIERAERAGTLGLATAFDDVYATTPWHLAEQRSRAAQ